MLSQDAGKEMMRNVRAKFATPLTERARFPTLAHRVQRRFLQDHETIFCWWQRLRTMAERKLSNVADRTHVTVRWKTDVSDPALSTHTTLEERDLERVRESSCHKKPLTVSAQTFEVYGLQRL